MKAINILTMNICAHYPHCTYIHIHPWNMTCAPKNAGGQTTLSFWNGLFFRWHVNFQRWMYTYIYIYIYIYIYVCVYFNQQTVTWWFGVLGCSYSRDLLLPKPATLSYPFSRHKRWVQGCGFPTLVLHGFLGSRDWDVWIQNSVILLDVVEILATCRRIWSVCSFFSKYVCSRGCLFTYIFVIYVLFPTILNFTPLYIYHLMMLGCWACGMGGAQTPQLQMSRFAVKHASEKSSFDSAIFIEPTGNAANLQLRKW